ncbi:hypothetical protein [Amycolatopsis sp. NPDC049159]|uniref:hypothetical protein n=1 Tax=Amycolatopsis sp. NPDC049159 TaxID=3157210 RepID=UPI0033D43DD5
MARTEARLLFTVWEGLAVLSDAGKLAYFAVMTDPSLTQCGAGPLRPSRWSKKLGWRDEPEKIEAALSEMDEHRKIFVDHDTDEVLIRTFVRRDGVAKMPYVLRSALKAAVMIESHRLRKELAVELRTLHDERAAESSGLLRQVLDECLVVADELEGVHRPRPAAESAATAPAAAEEPGEKAPPERCPKHLEKPTNRPCRACGAAKDKARAWHAERSRAVDDERASDARARAEIKRKLVAACGLCDEQGYVGTAVCDHQPRALIKRRAQ